MKGVTGPCMVYGFDVENQTDHAIEARLFRNNGTVLVQVLVGPWRSIPPFDIWDADELYEHNRQLWTTRPGEEIVVPEGDVVWLQTSEPTKAQILVAGSSTDPRS